MSVPPFLRSSSSASSVSCSCTRYHLGRVVLGRVLRDLRKPSVAELHSLCSPWPVNVLLLANFSRGASAVRWPRYSRHYSRRSWVAETGVAETQSQPRPRGGLTLFVLFCAGVCVAALVGWPDKLVDGLEVEARALLDKPIGITWIVGVPALLILERVFAVDRPDYRDPAVVLSIFYSLIATPVLIVTVALFLDWQNERVTNHVAIVDLEFFQSWHPWAVGLFAFVTSDFLL